MVAYGKAGLRAEGLDAIDFLGRLYLHTVEFGLIREDNGLRGFGAGMLSSYSETVHAVTAPKVRRLRFNLPRVMRTEYLFDEFQKTYFVIESFEDLLKAAEETDFAPIYAQLRNLPLLAPDADCEGDVAYAPAMTYADD
jgi:phenylalanine-4-hydroxylase